MAKRDWQEKLLEAVEEHGSVRAACRAVKVGRRTVYDLRDEDTDFRRALEEAMDAGVEAAEKTLQERAIGGVSDTALIFFLKNRRPEVYGDRLKFEEREQIRKEARAQVLMELHAELREITPAARKRLMTAIPDAA